MSVCQFVSLYFIKIIFIGKKHTFVFVFYSLYIFVRIWFSYSKHYCLVLLVWFVWFILFVDISLVWCFQQVRSSLIPPPRLRSAVCFPLMCGIYYHTDSKHYCLVVWFCGLYTKKRTRLKSKCVYFV